MKHVKIEKLCNRSEHTSSADDRKFNKSGVWMKHSVDSPDSIDSPVYDVLQVYDDLNEKAERLNWFIFWECFIMS